MYDLFTKVYGYKHVHKYIVNIWHTQKKNPQNASSTLCFFNIFCINRLEYGDYSTNIEFPRTNFPPFFEYHRQQIAKDDTIDAFIFIYSGHGKPKGITCMKGRQYLITKIFEEFNNQNLQCLNEQPKIYRFFKILLFFS